MNRRQDRVPFLLSGTAVSPMAAKVQPAGHYDADRQVWIGTEGESVSHATSRGRRKCSWDASTKLDNSGYD